MANPEHLEILKQGVEVWNQWRKENPEVVPDLEGAEFRGAILEEVNFSEANLKCTNFETAHLVATNFKNADLQSANLKTADLMDTNFEKACLAGANLEGALLEMADLSHAHLDGANLKTANLEDTSLEEASLWEADLKKATLWRTNLEEASLWRANLAGTNLKETNLTNANVTNVKFDDKMYCRAIIVQGCHGSQQFVRHVRDLDYIEEIREKHPLKYWLWKLTSNCGRSIFQWAALSVLLALLFGAIFAEYPVWSWLPDWLQSVLTAMAPDMSFNTQGMEKNWFTPYYFSIVTFTTLGFGDITPLNLAGQIWLTMEVIIGYIMLGGLITLFATKMVRQGG